MKMKMKDWMAVNHLKLNEEVIELLVIGQNESIQKISGVYAIDIGDATITAYEKP